MYYVKTQIPEERKRLLSSNSLGGFRKPMSEDAARQIVRENLNSIGLRFKEYPRSRVKLNAEMGLIGMPSATEDQAHQGHFFAGISDESFHAVIVLCRFDDGHLEQYVLEKSFLAKFQPRLPRNCGGLLFNLQKRNNRMFLLYPSSQEEEITAHESNYKRII